VRAVIQWPAPVGQIVRCRKHGGNLVAPPLRVLQDKVTILAIAHRPGSQEKRRDHCRRSFPVSRQYTTKFASRQKQVIARAGRQSDQHQEDCAKPDLAFYRHLTAT
jgi:hypothetical protein